MPESPRDPAVHIGTDKVRFFNQTEHWRDCEPRDWKPFDEERAMEEQRQREVAREIAHALKPVCCVCRRQIPAYQPDTLLRSTGTGEYRVAHYYCQPPTRDRYGSVVVAKERNCVGGLERDH